MDKSRTKEGLLRSKYVLLLMKRISGIVLDLLAFFQRLRVNRFTMAKEGSNS